MGPALPAMVRILTRRRDRQEGVRQAGRRRSGKAPPPAATAPGGGAAGPGGFVTRPEADQAACACTQGRRIAADRWWCANSKPKRASCQNAPCGAEML